MVGQKYRGILSFPVLSEIFSVTISLEDYNERQKLLEIVYELVKIRKIKFYSARDTEEISLRVKEADKRILGLDREILSCAIGHKAITLVTLDKKLIGNQALEKEFSIRIKHPKELL